MKPQILLIFLASILTALELITNYDDTIAFLHDSVLKAEETSPESEAQAEAGLRLLYERCISQLLQTDEVCAKRIAKTWKDAINTTTEDKDVDFKSIKDYLEFRMIDTGAQFVEALMLFGLGMTLSPQQDANLAHIIRPCFAALALTNDYFSFDREMEEVDTSTLINSVAIVMRIQNLDIPTAKTTINETIQKYEREFLRRLDQYKQHKGPVTDNIEQYMEAMTYQFSGNLVWSLNCPRYNPEYRYGLEACQH
ncbi:hypothetical protein FPSE_11370 [Fusarium pseudograminearum CS3096]|uniref:Terpene synthase n=1 Tax=Fusarium pseudograminearum (strain CS3096) TaxID=1028729 RepID=K3V5C5_FUSPC|nr:hypothetical protein FPSE_11370 [Fusarium pseudograminearum CS3096]EKJ68362.1 hypothetical protein FPSE_11370 [Fusarium pseudograminearum CS3096]